VIGGLHTEHEGKVTVAGETISGPHKNIGMVFQEESTFPWRTVVDNVAFPLELTGMPKSERVKRARHFISMVGLDGFENRYPGELSGGMRQRVSLARTLVHDPPVILMDEPLGALDALTRLQVRMDLEALWLRRRPTVLFITHSVEEAVGLSDRILVMSPSPGEIVEEIVVELPRPRPLVLGDAPEFGGYVDRIHRRFERMGVLHGVDVAGAS